MIHLSLLQEQNSNVPVGTDIKKIFLDVDVDVDVVTRGAVNFWYKYTNQLLLLFWNGAYSSPM